MKCLLFFALVLLGVLVSSTEGCMPSDSSKPSSKSDSNSIPDHSEDATTIKSEPPMDAHTFSIIPAKSVVVIVTEKPTTAPEVMNKTESPEMMHSMEATTVKSASTVNTQKPQLVFAETSNKVPNAVASHIIITATPMIEEVVSMKPVSISLNVTEKSVNASAGIVSKPAVTAVANTSEHSTEKPALLGTETTAAIADEHSTEKPAVHVDSELTTKIITEVTLTTETMPTTAAEHSTEKHLMTKIATEANLANTTEKFAHPAAEMMMPSTAVTAEHLTEKPAHLGAETAAAITAEHSTEKPAVHVDSELTTKIATEAIALNTTQKSATEMMPSTAEHFTQKPAVNVAETKIISATTLMNVTEKPANLTMPTTAAQHSTEKNLTNTTEKPTHPVAEMMPSSTVIAAEHSTEKPAVLVVSELTTKIATEAIALNTTEKSAHPAAEMKPSSTAVPSISTEKSVKKEDEEMNKTAEATSVKSISMSTIVTATPMIIRSREKRQAANITTNKPEITTKNPSVPVSGQHASTTKPIPVTRRPRRNSTTIKPTVAGSRASTTVKSSPMPLTVKGQVTTKPIPVPAKSSVPPKV